MPRVAETSQDEVIGEATPEGLSGCGPNECAACSVVFVEVDEAVEGP